jgi:hypothetical protein
MIEICANFSIWSELLEPDEITHILQTAPDRTVIKGKNRNPPRARPPANGWHIECCVRDDIFVESSFLKLFSRLSLFERQYAELLKADSGIMTAFYVLITPRIADVSLYMSRCTVETISKFGGTLDIVFSDD